eukprot:375373-Pyramimonas_sp.AAC.1
MSPRVCNIMPPAHPPRRGATPSRELARPGSSDPGLFRSRSAATDRHSKSVAADRTRPVERNRV